MKLSEHTLTVLKNFSSINSSVVLQPGKIQKTLSVDQSVMVEAELPDEFPVKYGIYDLNQFLGNINALDKPDLEFNDNQVIMNNGSMSLCYHGCSPDLISNPGDKTLTLPNSDVEFALQNLTLTKLLKLATMNDLDFLSVSVSGGEVKVTIHNDTKGTNMASIVVGNIPDTEKTGEFKFKTTKLQLLPYDYKVSISAGKFGVFENDTHKIKYFISLESRKKQ